MKRIYLGLIVTTKRKRELLAAMDRVAPPAALIALAAQYAPKSRRGRLPIAVITMLRFDFLQRWGTR